MVVVNRNTSMSLITKTRAHKIVTTTPCGYTSLELSTPHRIVLSRDNFTGASSFLYHAGRLDIMYHKPNADGTYAQHTGTVCVEHELQRYGAIVDMAPLDPYTISPEKYDGEVPYELIELLLLTSQGTVLVVIKPMDSEETWVKVEVLMECCYAITSVGDHAIMATELGLIYYDKNGMALLHHQPHSYGIELSKCSMSLGKRHHGQSIECLAMWDEDRLVIVKIAEKDYMSSYHTLYDHPVKYARCMGENTLILTTDGKIVGLYRPMYTTYELCSHDGYVSVAPVTDFGSHHLTATWLCVREDDGKTDMVVMHNGLVHNPCTVDLTKGEEVIMTSTDRVCGVRVKSGNSG